MTEKQEKYLRKALNYFISESLILHARGFDKNELTVEEFTEIDEMITKKMLNNIDFIMQ